MSTTDDLLAQLLGKNSDLFAAYEEWANAQIMLLAGTIDDPASFNADGGKTGALGYYPVVNVNGETKYIPCLARLQAMAAGSADPEMVENLLALQVGNANAAAEIAVTAAAALTASRFQAETRDIARIGRTLVVGAAGAVRSVLPGGDEWDRTRALANTTVSKAAVHIVETRDPAQIGQSIVAGSGGVVRAVLPNPGAIALDKAVAVAAAVTSKASVGFVEIRDPAWVGQSIIAGESGGIRAILPNLAGAALAKATEVAAAVVSKVTKSAYEIRDAALIGAIAFVGSGSAVRDVIPAGNSAAVLAQIAAKSASQPTRVSFETRDAGLAGQLVLVGAGGAIRVVAGVNGAIVAATNDATARLTALAGKTASPAARVAAVVTQDGAPRLPYLNRDTLTLTKQHLLRLDPDFGAENILYTLNIAGDSYSQNRARYTERVAKKLKAKRGDGGAGWISLSGVKNGNQNPPWTSGNQPALMNGCVLASYPVKVYGSPTLNYYSAKSPDLASLTMLAAGDAAEVGFPAGHPNTAATLWFVAASGAQVRYTIDGSTFTSLSLDGSTGTQIQGGCYKVAIPMPASAGTLRVEWVAGSPEISGVYALGTKGVIVNKLAATGSRVTQWAGAAAEFESLFAALGAHAVMYMDGTNSQTANMTVAAWGSSVQTLTGRFRSASAPIDVLLATPPENQRGLPILMSDYADEGRRIAVSLRVAFRDMQDLFGPASNPASYAYGSAKNLFAADGIHPDEVLGGPELVDGTLEMFPLY